MNQEKVEPQKPLMRFVIPLACVLVGLSLIPLLPLGALLPLGHPYFLYTFFAHLGFFALALLLVFIFLIEIASKTSFGTSICIVLVLLIIISELFLGALPITSRDALIHHLVVPKWWIRDDQILTYSWHEWSYYPMLLNLGFTGLMKLGLVQFTPLYHYLFLILLAGVVSSFCFFVTRSEDYSYFSFVLTLTVPMCIRLGSEPLVDLGLALFMTVAFVLSFLWAEEKRGVWVLFFVGLSLGLAMSAKYNGLLATGIFCALLILPSLRIGNGIFKSVLLSAFCASLAFALMSPWMVRNLIPTGNPFFPLFHGLFGTGTPGPEGVAGLKPIEKLFVMYGENWWEILLLPFRMLLFGQDHNPRLFDGQLTPLLILFFLPAFFERKRPWLWFAIFFCVAYLGLTICLAGARVRYLAPLYGVLLILTVIGIWGLSERVRPRFRRIVLGAAAAFHLTIAIAYTLSFARQAGLVDYISGNVSEADYLRMRIPEYEMIEYVNKELPADSLTYLLLTGNRFYYFEKDIISGGYHSANQVIKFIQISAEALDRDSAEYLSQEFLHRNINYILLHNNRTVQTLGGVLSNREKMAWNNFEREFLELVEEKNGYSLWRILPSSRKEELEEKSVTDDVEDGSLRELDNGPRAVNSDVY